MRIKNIKTAISPLNQSSFFRNESYEYAFYLLCCENPYKFERLGITRLHYTQRSNELAKKWITNICNKLNANELDEDIKKLAFKQAAEQYKAMYSPAPKKRKNKN